MRPRSVQLVASALSVGVAFLLRAASGALFHASAVEQPAIFRATIGIAAIALFFRGQRLWLQWFGMALFAGVSTAILHATSVPLSVLYCILYAAPCWIINVLLAQRFRSGAPREPERLYAVRTSADAEFNVIFIHGIHGHHITTWSTGQSEGYWPKWLSESFPQSSIYSLQYSAFVTAWLGPTMPMYDRATNLLDLLENEGVFGRPTIFIVHSYGGLVVKQLWRTAHDRNLKNVLDSVRAVIFLATPHSGSNLGAYVRYVLPQILTRTSTTADELRFGEASLRDLNTWYRHHPVQRNLVFFETLPTQPFDHVVDSVSADPGIAGVFPVGLPANHVTICKPQSRDEQVVRSVNRHLSELVEQLRETGSAAPRKLPAGVDASPQALMLQIQSGNADIVDALLKAGVQMDIVIDGRTPLQTALDELARSGHPISNQNGHVAVLSAILSAGPPRDLPMEAYRAFDNRQWPAILALRMAGMAADVAVGRRAPLLRNMLRISDEIPQGWLRRFLAAGPGLPEEMSAYVLLWSCRNGQPELAKFALESVNANARLDAALPEYEIGSDELIYWYPGGIALHMLAASCYDESMPLLADALLSRGADPLTIDQNGNTPLMVAIAERKFELAKRLVAVMDAPAILTINRNRRSALEMVVGNGSMLAVLLAATGNPPAARGAAAVHRAAYEYDFDSMQKLLDAGVDVDAVQDGVTPLLRMSQFWYSVVDIQKPARLRCWSLLLARGASVHATDTDGKTALHFISQFGDIEALEMLLSKGADVNAPDSGGRTPLMYAAGQPAAAVLLRAGARPADRDRNGYSPLDWAVMSGAENPHRYLGPVDQYDVGSPHAWLAKAVQGGELDTVRRLLQTASPDACDRWGEPLLHIAAANWDYEVVTALLGGGAHVDRRDEYGRTALYKALTSSPNGLPFDRMRQTVEILLKHGASIRDINGRGDSAAHVGWTWWFDSQLARHLLRICRAMVNASGETVLMRAVERGSAEQVRQALADAADVRAVDTQGRSALFRRSPRHDGLENTLLLLNAGADANLADQEGITPLMVAARGGDVPTIELLIKYGANPFQRNQAGKTARGEATYAGSLDASNVLWYIEAETPR